MKKITFFLLAIFLSCNHLDNPTAKVTASLPKGGQVLDSSHLFPIIQEGRWGYINEFGENLIAPKFRSAGQFSEGLAPARINGTYGFINKTGDFSISPQYDFAAPFRGGRARVYLDGTPYYIDKQGEIIFKHDFVDIKGFDSDGYSVVTTKGGRHGVINQQGELLVDTIFSEIHSISDGLVVVEGMNHNPYPGEDEEETYEVGVINVENGKYVVPFGKFEEISAFQKGFAKVRFKDDGRKAWERTGIIDKNGKILFNIPNERWDMEYYFFIEGLSSANIHGAIRYENSHMGVVDTKGNIVINDKKWEWISVFNNGRAFALRKKDEKWFLIDNSGKILNEQPYEESLFSPYGSSRPPFENGTEFVRTPKGWGAINQDGEFVIPPRAFSFDYSNVYREGDILYFQKDAGDEKYHYKYGFWDTKTDVVVPPRFHHVNLSDFSSPLTYAEQDGKPGYINRNGEYVWQQPNEKQMKDKEFDIDYMKRGYFYASSPFDEKLAGAGGWGPSGNGFKKLSRFSRNDNDQFNISVKTPAKTSFAEQYQGQKLHITNNSKDTFYFRAQDSRLYLKIQAKDKNGEWRDIEYLPSSWCGNSYHSLFLPPKHYWEFTIPKYHGEYKTALRAELSRCRKKAERGEEMTVYSHEFDGSINPGQFWRKTPYSPGGLMDPYLD